MKPHQRFLPIIFFITLFIFSCSKQEQIVVLKDRYAPGVGEAEGSTEEFTVILNAKTLQSGESGEWKVLSGMVVENFVALEDKKNPFSKFKGIPGEEYKLEWIHRDRDGTITALQTTVRIPLPKIIIEDQSPVGFQTIKTLVVNAKYRGTWSISGNYAQLVSKYHDGTAEPAEKKPSIELHGYENTEYTATFKYIYAGKVFNYQFSVRTGDYTQAEGLYVLQIPQGDSRTVVDNSGNILELNLQASGIAWIFGEPNKYPALSSFKKLRKLILGGSSLSAISPIFGDHYRELEELDIDGAGNSTVFPENLGNLTKLKVFLFAPRNSFPASNEILLPKSFANLKALESFTVKYAGFVNFNGTLGSLTNLKVLRTAISHISDDIGALKMLEHIELTSRSSYFPSSFADCSALRFARLSFDNSASGDLVLSNKMGDLKNLETLEINSNKLRSLPVSFSVMPLKTLKIIGTELQTVPENFGELRNLQSLEIYGSFTRLPTSFGNLTKLTHLTLGGKTELLPEQFGNLSSLVYFNAQSSSIKLLPESFGRLKNLKEINMQLGKLERLPDSFGELDALETLNLAANPIKTFPKAILALKNIKTINLNSTLSGDIPDEISKMKTGVAFNLYSVPNLTVDHLRHILSISTGKVYYTGFGFFSS